MIHGAVSEVVASEVILDNCTNVNIHAAAILKSNQAMSLVECGFDTDLRVGATVSGSDGTIMIGDLWTSRGGKKQVVVKKGGSVVDTFAVVNPDAYTVQVEYVSGVVTAAKQQDEWTYTTRQTIGTLCKLVGDMQ